MKKIVSIIFSISFIIPAYAEMMTVSGIVIDENGEPLPGANVSAENTPHLGAATDIDGKFTIENFPTDEKIKVSYIGFQTETLNPETELKITLKETSSKISEVSVVAEWKSSPCSEEQLTAINAKSGMTARNPNGYGVYCVPDACVFGYKLNKKAEKCEKIECSGPRYVLNEDGDDCKDMVGEKCTSTDPNAKEAKYKWENNQLICEIKKCNDHYIPNDDGSACILSDGPCSAEQIAKIEHATAGELKNGKCYATECDLGYDPKDGICIVGDCNHMPKNAIKAHREYNEETQQEVCIIDECKEGYTRAPDFLSCIEPILSEEDAKKEIEELQENADEMKAKEQSTANKLLGGASIGAMGIGGMQTLSALSEQRADTAAEQDMEAYLATFRCDYGQGKNILGGETGIELPGGNQLFSLYNEYIQLAADLKIRKEALGLTPGIESETILDKSETGLYDDVGTGKTDGAYASLSAALSDPNSAAAAAWAEQKADTAQQLKTGLITAGIGAAVGIVGNLAINENRKAAQESSDDIKAKYAPLKSLENNVKALPDQEANAKCPEDATGFYPDCNCNDTNKIYNSNLNICEKCPENSIPFGKNQCIPKDQTIASITPNNTSLPNKLDNILEILPLNQESPSSSTISLSASQLFELNSYELTDEATQIIKTFADDVNKRTGSDKNYCITVIGHTDKTGNNNINNQLSKNRAESVKTALIQSNIESKNIVTEGQGSTKCTPEFRKQSEGCAATSNNCKACRKVEISFSTTSCGNS